MSISSVPSPDDTSTASTLITVSSQRISEPCTSFSTAATRTSEAGAKTSCFSPQPKSGRFTRSPGSVKSTSLIMSRMWSSSAVVAVRPRWPMRKGKSRKSGAARMGSHHLDVVDADRRGADRRPKPEGFRMRGEMQRYPAGDRHKHPPPRPHLAVGIGGGQRLQIVEEEQPVQLLLHGLGHGVDKPGDVARIGGKVARFDRHHPPLVQRDLGG